MTRMPPSTAFRPLACPRKQVNSEASVRFGSQQTLRDAGAIIFAAYGKPPRLPSPWLHNTLSCSKNYTSVGSLKSEHQIGVSLTGGQILNDKPS